MLSFNKLVFILNELAVSMVGFALTMVLIPMVVTLAWRYNLVYLPNNRTSHIKPVPAIGGIPVFIGFLVSGILMAGTRSSEFYFFAAGIAMIFLTGIIDDTFSLSASRKLILVTLAAMFVTIVGDIRLVSLHHFLGIDELPYGISIFLSVLLIAYVINAINLIDGIDGNAGITGIFALTIFNILFITQDYLLIMEITLPVILVYAAFLIYNLWGRRYKIFMGDTGSLILGFVIAITIIKFCNLNAGPIYVSRLFSPLTVFAILVVPLFDQLHVFIKRIRMGRSPFVADRNHLHHTWLKLGFSHRGATLILLGYGIFFFLLNTFILQNLPIYLHILVLVILL